MSIDVTILAKYAAEAVAMPSSLLLRDQCLAFAAYARRTKWHHSVRREAMAIAKVFDEIASKTKGA